MVKPKRSRINKKRLGGVLGGAVALGVGAYATSKLGGSSSSSSSSSSSDSSSQGKGKSSSGDDSSSSSGSSSGSSSSSSSSSSGSGGSDEETPSAPSDTSHSYAEIPVPDHIHITPPNMSIQRAGIEVYKTDEASWTPYQSPYNAKAQQNTDPTKVEDENIETEDSSDSETNTENDYENRTFILHRGDIQETYYYADLTSISFDSDYKDMSNSGTINKQDVNLTQFFKGIHLHLYSQWEEPLETLEWNDLLSCMDGFITEQTFNEEDIELKISGMTILLEQTLEFKFSQCTRSSILREIILSAGLNPIINVEGLDDDILDFVNEANAKKTGGSSNSPIGESSGNIAELAQQVCKGKTSDKDKAMAIHTYIQHHVDYPSPNYSDHHKCPMQVLQSGLSNCCDRARLGHEMANAVGLQNRGVHGPEHVWIQYKINGKWVNSDPSKSRTSLGSVYHGLSMDSVWKFPSCK